MMTSSNGNIFRVTGHFGEFPAQRPVTRSFDVLNVWVNNRKAGDLRRYRAHYDVIVMIYTYIYIYINAGKITQRINLKMDHHTRGKRFNRGSKHRKDENQLLRLKHCEPENHA